MNTAVYVTLCVIWSSTWLAITVVIRDVPPVSGAAARFWLAAAIYLSFHAVRRLSFPADLRSRLGMIALGIPQITVSYSFVYWGEQYISSGMTALLFATFPLWVAVFSARWVVGEPWTLYKFIGLVCGIVGVAVVSLKPAESAITTDGVTSTSLPMLATLGVLFGAFVCGLSIVWIKRLYGGQNAVALTASQMLGGALGLTAAAFMLEEPMAIEWTRRAVIATVYLAVFGSALAFFGYYWLLQRVEGTLVATINFVTPVLTIFFGWLVLGEPLSANLFVGGALVLAGVWSVVGSAKRSRRLLASRPPVISQPSPALDPTSFGTTIAPTSHTPPAPKDKGVRT